MKFRLVYICLVVVVLLSSCSKEKRFECFVGNGDTISEIRKPGSFSKINIKSHIITNFIQDSLDFIEVSAGNNIISKVKTYVKEDTLIIENTNKCNWARKYEDVNIIIHFTSMTNIEVNGEAIITNEDTITDNSLIINVYSEISEITLSLNNTKTQVNIHAATGDYKFSGQCSNFYLYCHGTAHIHAEHLITDNTYVNHQSTGDFYVNAQNLLNVILKSTGDLYYKGNPEIMIKELSSTGRLIHLQ